jgi:hypothetical protein
MAKGRRIQYRSFEDARSFARALCLRNKDEWTRFAKGELEGHDPKPKDIPSRVDKIYKGQGWCGFDDFLSTKKTKEARKSFRAFEQARSFARALRLGREDNWKLYIDGKMDEREKLPTDIPRNPQDIYKDKGWIGWSDWLSEHYHPESIVYRSFEDSKAFVHELGIKSLQEWEAYRNGENKDLPPCPKDIPVWPPRAYKNKGWNSWADWLGLTFGRKSRLTASS